MQNNTLYRTLVRSVYALDGADGEFLGDLARPIQLPERQTQGCLAVIPAVRARHLRDSIRWVSEAREDLIADILDAGEDVCWEQERLLDQPSETTKLILGLEAELIELEAELEAL